MIKKIISMQNPNFFFLTYLNFRVTNFIFVPNYFFTPTIIEKRKPLSETAQRAGWVGCNIDIQNIPESGKIYIVKNSMELSRELVHSKYQKATNLKTNNIENRGWLFDILKCVERIPGDEFSLNEVYAFEKELQEKHPENNFIKDKIRQQLQCLRDKGFLEFLNRGKYRKIR